MTSGIIAHQIPCANTAAGAAGGRPLGIVTKNSSPQHPRGLQAGQYDPNTGEVLHVGRTALATRWALKAVVNNIFSQGHRTCHCHVYRAPVQGQGLSPIRVHKGKEHGKAFYSGLMSCGNVWVCPLCAAKISSRRRAELEQAIEAAKAEGLRVHFVTLTVPHGVGDDLGELLSKMAAATKRMSSGKHAIKQQLGEDLVGFIRVLEVTHGEHGWHPHFHLLVFTSNNVTVTKMLETYRSSWQRACRLSDLPIPSNEHGVTVQDGSQAAKYASKWGIEDEMTKGHLKRAKGKGCSPFGLLAAVLDEDDAIYPPERATSLFITYAKHFKGRRQLFWSVGLRERLMLNEELSDTEIAAQQEENATVLAELTVEQWKAIRRRAMEATILELAEHNPLSLPPVLASLASCGVKMPDEPSRPPITEVRYCDVNLNIEKAVTEVVSAIKEPEGGTGWGRYLELLAYVREC